MEIAGVELGLWGRVVVVRVILADGEGVEAAVDVLHVGDVAAEAEDDVAVEGAEALGLGEAGEGAIGGEVVGGDDNASAVFEGDDRGAGDYGGRSMGGRVGWGGVGGWRGCIGMMLCRWGGWSACGVMARDWVELACR